MTYETELLIGLFFVYGLRAVTAPLFWWLNRRFGWRSRNNQARWRNEAAVMLRTYRYDMTRRLLLIQIGMGPE
jgi:hypothetical protein